MLAINRSLILDVKSWSFFKCFHGKFVMNISSVIPFLLPHVFKHSHGLKKMETDTTDNQAVSDFHYFLIVDNFWEVIMIL